MTPKKVDKTPVTPPRTYDRRKLWVQIIAGLLVLAMLMPVAAGLLGLF